MPGLPGRPPVGPEIAHRRATPRGVMRRPAVSALLQVVTIGALDLDGAQTLHAEQGQACSELAPLERWY
jgi:hypothetical protein